MAQKTLPVPYVGTIPEDIRKHLVEGKVIVTVRGKVEFVAHTAQQFTICLADGNSYDHSNNVAIRFKALFDPDGSNCKIVYLTYKKNGTPGNYADIETVSSISRGTDFEVVITVKNRTFDIDVNDQSLKRDFDRAVPLETINRLLVDGDNLTLYEPKYQVRN